MADARGPRPLTALPRISVPERIRRGKCLFAENLSRSHNGTTSEADSFCALPFDLEIQVGSPGIIPDRRLFILSITR